MLNTFSLCKNETAADIWILNEYVCKKELEI